MNIQKNIKWVALLLVAMGYMASTDIAIGEKNVSSPSVKRVNVADDIERQEWKPVAVNDSFPASFADAKPNALNRPEALKPVFDVLCKSGRPLRVLHLGDSHVAGAVFPRTIRQTLEEAWGVADSASERGVAFNYIAKNGAQAFHFATPERMSAAKEKAPDLVIVSFGTNECHDKDYTEERHHAQLEQLLTMINDSCPNAVVLLTTPPGDYMTTRSVSYVGRKRGRKRRKVVHKSSHINQTTERGAAVIERFGAEHGLPVWDLNAMTGGYKGVDGWIAAGMMRPDKVHFTPEGYTIQGRLLAGAILSAYNEYVKK